MPRPQRPLDPSAGPVAEFAGELRQLHERAGSPKFLAMSRRTGRSRTALSEAVGGDHLPSWETVVAFVTACGERPEAWLGRWEKAKTRAAEVPPVVLAPDPGAPDPDAPDATDDEDETHTSPAETGTRRAVGRREFLWLGAGLGGGVVAGVAGTRMWEAAKDGARRPGGVTVLPGTAGRAALVAFSPFAAFVAGDLVTGGNDRRVTLWRTGDRVPVGQVDTRQPAVAALAFDPLDRNVVATSGGDGLVWLFDVAAQRATLSIPYGRGGRPAAVAFDPLLRGLVSLSGAGGKVGQWDTVEDELAGEFATANGAVGHLAHDPHRSGQLGVAGDRTAEVWDLRTNTRMSRLTGVELPLRALAFDPLTRNTLAAAGRDGSVRIWDSTTGKPARPIEPARGVTALAFNPQIRNSLASGDAAGRLQIWDSSTGLLVRTLRATGPPVTSIAYSPDGRVLACGSATADVELWPIEDW